jgi:putative transposase
MTQLTEQFHLPDEYHDACDRLTTFVQTHTRRLLADEYWNDEHLAGISDHGGQSYTYIRDNNRDDFADVTEYVYSRFKRCVYHCVTHVLDAHTDECQAFQFVTDTVDERKIRPIGWERLRTRLYDEDSPYIEWRVLESSSTNSTATTTGTADFPTSTPNSLRRRNRTAQSRMHRTKATITSTNCQTKTRSES